MNDKLFNELLSSIHEAGKIKRGEKEPSAKHVVQEIDVKSIRAKFSMTQYDFASFVGISLDTLRNWEQKRRKPHGPAKVLLRFLDQKPEAFAEFVLQR